MIINSGCLLSQDSTRYNKAGFAAGIGTGLLYGGIIGGLAEYQISLKDKIRITPLAGFGYSFGGAYPDDTINTEGVWLNYSLGINFEYGKKHRLIVGPQFIGANYISKALPNETIDKRAFVGYSFIAGYKGTAAFGLIWQLYLGLGHIQDPLMDDMKYYFQPHYGFGLGYKF